MGEREYKDMLKKITSDFIQKLISFATFDSERKRLKALFNSDISNQPATVKEVIDIFGGEVQFAGGKEPDFLK